MSSDGAEKTVMTLWRRDCPAVRSRCGGGNRKSSAVDRRKSEEWYWYNETVGARGAEWASTRYVGNAIEWSQIPGCDATENFMGQHGDLELYSLRNQKPAANDRQTDRHALMQWRHRE